jgi:putative pyruvate formate lyase activating enzyme
VLCPQACGVDRLAGETGFCRAGKTVKVAGFGPHHGEEAALVGRGGSGTIFFAYCNLRCVFCQNYNISQFGEGSEMTAAELGRVMLGLQERGCENVNLVTPTHYVPQILEALQQAAERGLRIPLVYNCGSYECLETLRLLDGIIDIYLPDSKYSSAEKARRYSGVEDYPLYMFAALREMHRQVGDLQLDKRGVAVRGLMIRHLVLPGDIAGTAEVLRFIATELSRQTYVNLMNQYYPAYQANCFPEINRRPAGDELLRAAALARELGLTRVEY